MQAQIFNASAGSGKTYRLAYKYVKDVVSEPLRYRHILAVTFTNKATEEMKSRILREIDTLSRGAKSPYMDSLCQELNLSEQTIRARAHTARGYILHDYSRFTVLTIDRFFQRILRAFIQELGLDLNYNIEIESSTLLERGADSLIEQITDDEELRRWLLEFVEERVEEGRRWDILDGVLSLSTELLKESNRDTLKHAPSKEHIRDVVARSVSRCKKSQEEYAALGQRAVDIITHAGATPADFKGRSRSFAYTFERIARGERRPLTKTFRNMALGEQGWCDKGSVAQGVVVELLPILKEICDHYDRDVRLWNTTSLVKENYRSFAILTDLYARVRQICDEQGVMLLSETKHILSEFIRGNDAPFIYEKTGVRYERFMIDEFQDTSQGEWHNFLPLLENAMSQSEDSTVLIVGDIKQSIYRWRGGDWRILHTRAKQEMGEQRCEVVTLQDNFRSLPRVVEFNNTIIEAVVESENNYLNGLLDEADLDVRRCAELRNMLRDAYSSHAQTPRKRGEAEGYVEVSTFEETPPIDKCIREIIDRGFSPSDIMILTRSNSEGVRVANMLLEFKERNEEPRYRFDIMTREALVVGLSPVSRFVIANFKLSLNAADLTQLAIYNSFIGGRDFDTPLPPHEAQMLRSVGLKSLEEAFEQVVMYHNLSLKRENIAYLQALHEQLISFNTSRIADISLFVGWWESQGWEKSLSVERSDSSIEITTIHKAKGLEKRVVIIPFCNWSLNPKTMNTVWARGDEAIESLGNFPVPFRTAMRDSQFFEEYYKEMVYSHIDNVNLLYVALTRAVESLHIFIPQSATKRGKATTTTNSRVGDLLLSVMPQDAKFADSGDSVSYTFGESSPPIKEADGGESLSLHIMDSYPTSKCDMRLRLPSSRYREDDDVQSDARHMGVLMHKLFEEAYGEAEIYSKLNIMHLNGYISQDEHQRLRGNIETALENPQVKGWFGDEWDEVRCESDIMIPQSRDVRRPDRVMIREGRAVVVEYKFTQRAEPSHKEQLGEYMKLLTTMGYDTVEGYLWYIKIGEIIKV